MKLYLRWRNQIVKAHVLIFFLAYTSSAAAPLMLRLTCPRNNLWISPAATRVVYGQVRDWLPLKTRRMRVHARSSTWRASSTALDPMSEGATATMRRSEGPARRRQGDDCTNPRQFSDFGLTPATLQAIKKQGITHLTPIQAETLPAALNGEDMLARAKTGTGKTLGFLVPSIERMARNSESGIDHDEGTRVLVISPARELAMQIEAEATKLMRSHHGLRAECIYGGRKIGAETRRMRANPPALLVATPGRLVDHLENTPGFAARLGCIDTLVLDECDQLLDMGFWKGIRDILRFLPPPAERQTLLFSATMDAAMVRTAREVLRPGYGVVDMVGEEKDATVSVVEHRAVVAPLERQLETLMGEIRRAQSSGPDHKAIVFFPTAHATKYAAELFNLAGVPVLEMHSRLTQNRRQRVSKQFRGGEEAGSTKSSAAPPKNGRKKGGKKGRNHGGAQDTRAGTASPRFMFSSDVSARGLDYPGVTHVFQVGLPSSREQYIHRSGRTGRAGTTGIATLLVTDAEAEFALKCMLSDLPLVVSDDETKNQPSGGGGESGNGSPLVAPQHEDDADLIARAKKRVSRATAERAYQAYLGFQKGFIATKKKSGLGWSKERLVEEANALSVVMGLPEPPVMNARMLGKMGLRGTKGLRTKGARE